mmetsp:Transcript_15466/g.47083  ORF Transcript_15466/g.47083 Transcript_15466/m.47083 type:complete len:302 (-) Transcript_15466:55-960(-)
MLPALEGRLAHAPCAPALEARALGRGARGEEAPAEGGQPRRPPALHRRRRAADNGGVARPDERVCPNSPSKCRRKDAPRGLVLVFGELVLGALEARHARPHALAHALGPLLRLRRDLVLEVARLRAHDALGHLLVACDEVHNVAFAQAVVATWVEQQTARARDGGRLDGDERGGVLKAQPHGQVQHRHPVQGPRHGREEQSVGGAVGILILLAQLLIVTNSGIRVRVRRRQQEVGEHGAEALDEAGLGQHEVLELDHVNRVHARPRRVEGVLEVPHGVGGEQLHQRRHVSAEGPHRQAHHQ